jgi:hypothetical protein
VTLASPCGRTVGIGHPVAQIDAEEARRLLGAGPFHDADQPTGELVLEQLCIPTP